MVVVVGSVVVPLVQASVVTLVVVLVAVVSMLDISVVPVVVNANSA